MNYQEFLDSKIITNQPSGFDVGRGQINCNAKDFQKEIIRWSLGLGRSAMFCDTGLGKTIMSEEWGSHVATKTGKPVLMFSPLAVVPQDVREAKKFSIKTPVIQVSSQADVPNHPVVCVSNYQKLHKFDPSKFSGIILQESSILKSLDGKTKEALVENFSATPYRLCCTATPAPNDVTELGNHAEFLGVMKHSEMLATFFTHNSGNTQEWVLKGHAIESFWKWVASWAVFVRMPSDLGFSDDGYILPPLNVTEHVIESGATATDSLFVTPAIGLDQQRKARRFSIDARVKAVADLVNNVPGQWLVWCELNDESSMLADMIKGAVEIAGSTSDEDKVQRQMDFTDQKLRVLVTKASIAGWGMNWQQCNQMAFVGITHSFEQFYQSVRRCHRFGQTKSVQVHVFTSDLEELVLDNLKRKQVDNDINIARVVEITSKENKAAMKTSQTHRKRSSVTNDEVVSGTFRALHGDTTERIKEIESDSIDYTIFSPPFAQLFSYTDLPQDMGNCRDLEEFTEHFKFLIPELLRICKPGRLLSFHCMNLPSHKERDGVIGLKDFRGDLIRMFRDAGWIYHSEVVIWKDPVTAMQRTKALGLLHKQIKKDAAMSRQGIPDYLVTMRKPGINPDPVTHYGNRDDMIAKTNGHATIADEMKIFPVDKWQQYASPVWMDIDSGDTLNYQAARDNRDERHICPLQLGVIERCVELWTNPGDLVFTPFLGIGSELYQSIIMGRRGIGCELKSSYFKVAVQNLFKAEAKYRERDLFSELEEATA